MCDSKKALWYLKHREGGIPMKRWTVGAVILFFTVINVYSHNYDLWGVWNEGKRVALEAVDWEDGELYRKTETSTGIYLQIADNGLWFEPDDDGRMEIIYQGGYYIIESLTDTSDGYQLLVRSMWNVSDEKEEAIRGIVNVHFLDKDTVWFELMKNDKRTSPKMPKYDFKGRDYPMWRCKLEESKK